ncbi:TetR/AcrR family transcriptional regulator [bacterium]|nr:TetR/AcrR family transcriptional regulator [bacterium]
MGDREEQRRLIVAGASAYVVAEGLTKLSLRPLAARLGTSDRMLLYYFDSKDELVAEVLQALSADLRAVLAASIPARRVPVRTLVEAADALLARPEMRSSAALCLELLGLAARGADPYATAARSLLADWIDWAETRLSGPPRGRRARAVGAVACIEGILVLRAVGLGERLRGALGGLLR